MKVTFEKSLLRRSDGDTYLLFASLSPGDPGKGDYAIWLNLYGESEKGMTKLTIALSEADCRELAQKLLATVSAA